MSVKRSSEKAFPEEEPEFQVAPMIDILLVLMTFFMSITSTEVIKTQPKIENFSLPVAKDSKTKSEGSGRSEIVINVGWNPANKGKEGVIDLEDHIYKDPGDLTAIVERRKASQPALRAVIRCSEQVPYSYVQQVMMACAGADVDNITFAVLAKDLPKDYANK